MIIFYTLRRLTGILFIAAIIFGSIEAKSAPMLILAIATALIAAGVPSAIYAFKALERYKNVFDYEPAELWGKMRNGKDARDTLLGISTAGIWCTLSGIALVLIVYLNITVILAKP